MKNEGSSEGGKSRLRYLYQKKLDFISLTFYHLLFQFNFDLIPKFENDCKLHFKNYYDDTFERLWAFKCLNFEQF